MQGQDTLHPEMVADSLGRQSRRAAAPVLQGGESELYIKMMAGGSAEKKRAPPGQDLGAPNTIADRGVETAGVLTRLFEEPRAGGSGARRERGRRRRRPLGSSPRSERPERFADRTRDLHPDIEVCRAGAPF